MENNIKRPKICPGILTEQEIEELNIYMNRFEKKKNEK